MDDECNKQLAEAISDFSSFMDARAIDARLKQQKQIDELQLEYKELEIRLTSQEEHKSTPSYVRLIELLELEIDSIKGRVKSQDILIAALEHQIETYKATTKLTEVVFTLNDKTLDSQEGMIDKYQKGPKTKSSVSQQKWDCANRYFLTEIPKHKTLKAARLAAAKMAGIVVEERQLIKMMPDPNK
jgi:hypothetical protein